MNILRWHDLNNPQNTWFMIELDIPEKYCQKIEFSINGEDYTELPRTFSKYYHSAIINYTLDAQDAHKCKARISINDEIIELIGDTFVIPVKAEPIKGSDVVITSSKPETPGIGKALPLTIVQKQNINNLNI